MRYSAQTSPGVEIGLERLLTEQLSLIRGRRVGLLCHPASVDSRLNHAADLLCATGALRRLFGPEHGIRGDAQDMEGVDSARDSRTGLDVVSLYGQHEDSLKPATDAVAGLDLVLVDLQDVGSRYYTYVWSTVMVLETCAAAGVEVVVLDRPNPLGGVVLEGPAVEPGFTSFVGYHDVPVRHGLTIGEVARLAAAERKIDVALTVVHCRGWRRGQGFEQTGLPWVLPSPNMPTVDTALVYPGGCLLEGTTLNEGRGTTRPFELFGAPWVEPWRLQQALTEERLPGVAFRPLVIRPTFHKHAGQACGGLQVHVTDPRTFRPLRTYVALLRHLHRLWPDDFDWRTQAYEFVDEIPAIDLLAGGEWLRVGVESGADLSDLCQGWAANEAAFEQRRKRYLLYR